MGDDKSRINNRLRSIQAQTDAKVVAPMAGNYLCLKSKIIRRGEFAKCPCRGLKRGIVEH
jgi:hypothetical protein